MGKGSELLAGVVLGCFLCCLFIAVIPAIADAMEKRKAVREKRKAECDKFKKEVIEHYNELVLAQAETIKFFVEQTCEIRKLIETHHTSQVSEPSDKSDKSESAAPAPASAQK